MNRTLFAFEKMEKYTKMGIDAVLSTTMVVKHHERGGESKEAAALEAACPLI